MGVTYSTEVCASNAGTFVKSLCIPSRPGTLVRSLRLVNVSVAQAFGLFCDIGIPLLTQRFSNYEQTLADCLSERQRCFTAREQDLHHTDYAQIGALMARSWGLSPTVCLAVRLHHDYSVFSDPLVQETVSRLVAMGLVAKAATQRFAGMSGSTEWDKSGDCAAGALLLTGQEADDWIDRICRDFANGQPDECTSPSTPCSSRPN